MLLVLTVIVILTFTEVLQGAASFFMRPISSALEDHVCYDTNDTAPDRKSEAVEGSGAHARVTK